MRIIFLILSLFIISNILAQEDNIIRVFGDSLVGKKVNGETIREVNGNVVMMQGAVKITCSKAIHNITKNIAELIGNVIVKQDSITIYTDLGYYYGNSKIAFSKSGVTYFDGHVHLKAKNGYYYFDDKKAFFFNDVVLNDSTSVLTTDTLIYYDNDDKAVAIGNVVVKDTSAIIYADSLIHYRDGRITYAYRNVRIIDNLNRLLIFGEKLEDYHNKNYSKILGNTLLIKIDTTNNGKLDTLLITAKIMEAFGDSSRRLIAIDSVKVVRGEFASVNNFSVYYQNNQHIYIRKNENDRFPPVLWNQNTQFIADTVNIFLENNYLKQINLSSNALIISKNNYEFRYDQIAGNDVKLFFDSSGLKKCIVNGNVLSIYYLYEDGEPNGLLKSSAEEAIILFSDDKVEKVMYYGNPNNEYHPENLIKGKEKEFTLPLFILFQNRPTKKELLFKKEDLLEQLKSLTNGK
ncbi:MAG: hypothetical protein N2249_05490 [Melioribacter sp.]|nr:hypothetical protein [Melioribacter sp.]